MEDQGEDMQRANEGDPGDNAEGSELKKAGLYILCVALLVAAFVLGFLLFILPKVTDLGLWYTTVFLIGFLISFMTASLCWIWCYRKSRLQTVVLPTGSYRTAEARAPPARVQRIQEPGQRRIRNPAGASTSRRADFYLDTAQPPSGPENPLVIFSGRQPRRNLRPGQETTQAETSFSQERSSLLFPDTAEPTATAMSDVASEVSEIASKKSTGRERIRTRSVTNQQLDQASTSSAGQWIDPSVPGPSHSQSPGFRDQSERPVRHLRSSKKKTEPETQHSGRQSALKSPASGISTVASGGVRRREKIVPWRESVETKLDSDDSESTDSE